MQKDQYLLGFNPAGGEGGIRTLGTFHRGYLSVLKPLFTR